MPEGYLRPCIKCGAKTIKEDVCSKCRLRPETKVAVSRKDRETQAQELLSMAKEDAKKEYAYWNARWKGGDTSEEVRFQRSQMYALMTREDITEDTLI